MGAIARKSVAPNWPLLMDIDTACRYLSYNRHDFRALVAAGLLPPGREQMEGKTRWHRGELDRCANRLWNLEAEIDHEREKAHTRRAIEDFNPAALRRGN